MHGDDAPPFYLAGKGTGPLAQTDPNTRQFERDAANLTAVNAYTGNTDHLLAAMADQTEMKVLHMFTTGDPARNATFAYFADPNYFLTDFPSSTCETCINPAFAWNHGDIQPEIANTWLGFVGPGIAKLGRTGDVWTDHTDVRPTMLYDLGLKDTYRSDGRVIFEILRGGHGSHGHAATAANRRHRGSGGDPLLALGAAYKQLTAPFGLLSKASLKVSTDALSSGTSADDSHYTALEAKLVTWGTKRDQLANTISTLLDGVEFGHQHLNRHDANNLTARAWHLIHEVQAAAH